ARFFAAHAPESARRRAVGGTRTLARRPRAFSGDCAALRSAPEAVGEGLDSPRRLRGALRCSRQPSRWRPAALVARRCGAPSGSEKRFFLAMGENGPYSETSFYLEAKFFRNVDERNSDVNETSQERCGR